MKNQRTKLLFVVACALAGCAPNRTPSTLRVANNTASVATAYVAFGASSVVVAADWPFCTATGPLNCSFAISPNESRDLPLAGRHVIASLAANAPIACGSTKAEINLNNPAWPDVADISLVDGFNSAMSLRFAGTLLGPVTAGVGNERALGVYPYGCDICVARQHPSCGIPAGNDGCKTGTQYDPDVPCQAQGRTSGGGDNDVVIELLP